MESRQREAQVQRPRGSQSKGLWKETQDGTQRSGEAVEREELQWAVGYGEARTLSYTHWATLGGF